MSLPGIVDTCVGYSGGTSEWPTYESIGDHTECVRVQFNPAVLSYDQLLEWFFNNHSWRHNNTAYRQYMNGCWFHDEEQQAALQARVEMMGAGEVATFFAPRTAFYRAEEYHQKFYLKQQSQWQ